jgi:hypothetical protein
VFAPGCGDKKNAAPTPPTTKSLLQQTCDWIVTNYHPQIENAAQMDVIIDRVHKTHPGTQYDELDLKTTVTAKGDCRNYTRLEIDANTRNRYKRKNAINRNSSNGILKLAFTAERDIELRVSAQSGSVSTINGYRENFKTSFRKRLPESAFNLTEFVDEIDKRKKIELSFKEEVPATAKLRKDKRPKWDPPASASYSGPVVLGQMACSLARRSGWSSQLNASCSMSMYYPPFAKSGMLNRYEGVPWVSVRPRQSD